MFFYKFTEIIYTLTRLVNAWSGDTEIGGPSQSARQREACYRQCKAVHSLCKSAINSRSLTSPIDCVKVNKL